MTRDDYVDELIKLLNCKQLAVVPLKYLPKDQKPGSYLVLIPYTAVDSMVRGRINIHIDEVKNGANPVQS